MPKEKEMKISKQDMDMIMSELNKLNKLSDDELNNVAGGFENWDDGASYGQEVMCPCCGNSNRESINNGARYRYGVYDVYYCRGCRTPFGVDNAGWTFSLRY